MSRHLDVSIDVAGGIGGTRAGLDDLARAGADLVRAAEEVAGVAAVLASGAVRLLGLGAMDALLMRDALGGGSMLRCVETVGAALAQAAGPAGAGGEAAALAGLAVEVRATVELYRSCEATVDTAVALAQDQIAVLAVPTLTLLVLGPALRDRSPQEVMTRVDRIAVEAPWLVDAVVGGRDGLIAPVEGLSLAPAAPLLPLMDRRRVLGTVTSGGRRLGVLDDSGAVVAEPVAAPEAGARSPRGLGDLVRAQGELGRSDRPGRVRVVQVPQPDGSSAWVVQLPGTQRWDPRPGPNPFDLSTDVAAMAGDVSATASAVRAALTLAQAEAGRSGRSDPVMLVGHSQGGILAAAVVSRPDLRAGLHITHVVTSGAPIARFAIPRDVSVLSLEHVQDAVPRLDGTPNPDRPSWVTVTRGLPPDPEVGARTSAAHAWEEYALTAAEVDLAIARRHSVSLGAWSSGAAPFLSGGAGAVVRDYRLVRRAG